MRWINLSLSEVQIHFLDNQVVDAASHPVNFFICREGTYESRKLCAGCTASLRFQETGGFDYLIHELRTYHGEEKEFRGAMFIQ